MRAGAGAWNDQSQFACTHPPWVANIFANKKHRQTTPSPSGGDSTGRLSDAGVAGDFHAGGGFQ